MHRDDSIKSLVFFSRSGCLLPVLVILNLFFGWMFLKAKYWLMLEGLLLSFFLINSYIITRKIRPVGRRRTDVIDIEGKITEDRGKPSE